MHYRCIAILACLTSLQSNAMLKDPILRRTMTMSPSTEICTLSSLSLLPTSEPTTPKEKTFLRRVKTDHNFSCTAKLREKDVTEKLSLMKTFIKQLQKQKLEEEKKRLEQEEKQEWLKYVRESNNSGYFPHSGADCESRNYSYDSSTIADLNFFGNAGRGHMDF